MAYNFLGLVNDVCGRVNETPLTSANFSTAAAFYTTAKEAVNSAINRINSFESEWYFNHIEQEDTLAAGTIRYSLPSNCKKVNWNTFRIKRDATFGNSTQFLTPVQYEDYLDSFIDDEYNTSTGIRSIPTKVFQTLDSGYGVWPSPKENYTLVYEYFQRPTDLSTYTDVPTIPEDMRSVIVNGALYYVYLFRKDIENADRVGKLFTDAIDEYRRMFINRYDSARDTRIIRPPIGISGLRTN